MRTPGADPAAKLLSTMLDVLTAEVSDPSRFGRGRTYARQGAVSRLAVQPAVVTAAVQGSQAQPYLVTIRVPLADGIGERRSSLIPHRRDVTFNCTCPDWDVPCKHAVAVMVHLSQRLAYEPSLLDTWRGVAVDSERVPLRQSTTTPVTPEQPVSAERLIALADFFGATPEVEIPRLGPAGAAFETRDEPWSSMLRDALRVLSPPKRGQGERS